MITSKIAAEIRKACTNLGMEIRDMDHGDFMVYDTDGNRVLYVGLFKSTRTNRVRTELNHNGTLFTLAQAKLMLARCK